LFGEPSGAVDHGAQRCTDAFVGGELARSLELDGQPRKRVGQYVVQFSRYAGAFGPRRGTGLVVPGVFELGEEQLGAVLAHPGLLHECPENGKHDAEEDRTGDGLGVGVRAVTGRTTTAADDGRRAMAAIRTAALAGSSEAA
jgi:hypothetical protein